MPYVEHTWTNGETITAAKMNNIEEGIAEAAQSGGGGGTACIRLSASAGFSSSSKMFCYFVYAYQENGNWVVSNDGSLAWVNVIGYAQPDDRLVVLPLPSDDSVGLFLLDSMEADNIVTGDISTTPTTLYYSWGSAVLPSNGAYRIMGNGSYQFVAT